MANPMHRNRVMWMGVRGHMDWVRAANTEPDFSGIGWGTDFQYLNGGAGVRSSVGSHKTYVMDWNTLSRDEARKITDLAEGVYNSSAGIELVYFLDPMAMDRNAAPQFWASPYQQVADGTTLIPGQAPVDVLTPYNTRGYPPRSVQYIMNSSSRTVWVPIPPGFTGWVGFHGQTTGAEALIITPTSGMSNLTPVGATVLGTNTDTRVTDSFDSTECDGITLSLPNEGAESTNTVTISGIIVQVLPTGKAPDAGGYISGQGNSGCQFAGKPTVAPRSAALDQVSLSATLIETGTWL